MTSKLDKYFGVTVVRVRTLLTLFSLVGGIVALSACRTTTLEPIYAAEAAATQTPPSKSFLSSTLHASPTSQVTGTVTVFAASSLTESFQNVKAAFEAANPSAIVTFNFASSSALRAQLEQGAKAEVFASADEVQMNNAIRAAVIDGDPMHFATNRLVVITPVDRKLASLADLAKPGLRLVLAGSEVPAGNYARQSLAKMNGKHGLAADFSDKALANLVSNEINVRQVVGKIVLGEGDAGIVYATDVIGDVQSGFATLPIPDEVNVPVVYPVAVVKKSANPGAARAFISFLRSQEGQAILARHGFGAMPQVDVQ
jgi:molybdate transport system substrate-binding protein